MTLHGYKVLVEGEERMQIAARHWGDASSPVFYRLGDDDEWKQCPACDQVGDCRHRPSEAVIMIANWLRMIGERPIGHYEEFELVNLDDEAAEEEEE